LTTPPHQWGFFFYEVFINKTNVKQKENIFEELNKMRNLIHTRPGVVISEQANASADAGTIMRELGNFNSDETKIVNILKNYKDKASFKNFVDQYKTISGKDFGADIMRAITPVNDKTEWNDLKTHLSSLGVALTHQVRDPRKGGSYAIFGGLSGAADGTTNTDDAWKTTYSCVTTQPGAKAVKMRNGSTAYLVGQIYYYANGRKKLADGTMGNYSCSTEFKSRAASNPEGRANVVSSYSKELQTSLGMTPTGQLSDADIDSILKRLEGGESVGATSSDTQSIPMDANGQPDIDKIIASL
jgi:hypothetical protein